jgi:hypothetical protein
MFIVYLGFRLFLFGFCLLFVWSDREKLHHQNAGTGPPFDWTERTRMARNFRNSTWPSHMHRLPPKAFRPFVGTMEGLTLVKPHLRPTPNPFC